MPEQIELEAATSKNNVPTSFKVRWAATITASHQTEKAKGSEAPIVFAMKTSYVLVVQSVFSRMNLALSGFTAAAVLPCLFPPCQG